MGRKHFKKIFKEIEKNLDDYSKNIISETLEGKKGYDRNSEQTLNRIKKLNKIPKQDRIRFILWEIYREYKYIPKNSEYIKAYEIFYRDIKKEEITKKDFIVIYCIFCMWLFLLVPGVMIASIPLLIIAPVLCAFALVTLATLRRPNFSKQLIINQKDLDSAKKVTDDIIEFIKNEKRLPLYKEELYQTQKDAKPEVEMVDLSSQRLSKLKDIKTNDSLAELDNRLDKYIVDLKHIAVNRLMIMKGTNKDIIDLSEKEYYDLIDNYLTYFPRNRHISALLSLLEKNDPSYYPANSKEMKYYEFLYRKVNQPEDYFDKITDIIIASNAAVLFLGASAILMSFTQIGFLLIGIAIASPIAYMFFSSPLNKRDNFTKQLLLSQKHSKQAINDILDFIRDKERLPLNQKELEKHIKKKHSFKHSIPKRSSQIKHGEIEMTVLPGKISTSPTAQTNQQKK